MNVRTVLRGALGAALLWCSASIHAEQYAIPLFVAAGPGGDPQGVLRLVSDADTAATVAIHAIDDAGARSGPATLTLNALSAVELSATELHAPILGNAAPYRFGDLERIEVLRGPQSSAFGRATFSGAINFVTRDPGEEQNTTIKTTFRSEAGRQAFPLTTSAGAPCASRVECRTHDS